MYLNVSDLRKDSWLILAVLIESNALQAELMGQKVQSQQVDHGKHDQSLGYGIEETGTKASEYFDDILHIQYLIVCNRF